VMRIATGAAAALNGYAPSVVAGVKRTRESFWDIGDRDQTGVARNGSHYGTWRTTPYPGGDRGFFDNRVVFTKRIVQRNPDLDVVFVSIHVNANMNPLDPGQGPFRVCDDRVRTLGASQALGETICDYVATELSLARDDSETHHIQVLWWNGCDLWWDDEITSYSEEEFGHPWRIARAMHEDLIDEPPGDTWGANAETRGIPAVIIEALQFRNEQDQAYIEDELKSWQVGQEIGDAIVLHWIFYMLDAEE